MTRFATALAAASLACIAYAASGVALVFWPATTGRLGYYALLAAGSTPRLAVGASIGLLLPPPAGLRGRQLGGMPLLALVIAAVSAGISGALAAIVFRAA